MMLEKYSIGIGDRFGREGAAQLRALLKAREEGTAVVPVWNKSHREHSIIGSTPADTRQAAQRAVSATGWKYSWYTDADHIGLASVGGFIPWCEFFTIDVAESIGRPPSREAAARFTDFTARFAGKRLLPDSAPVSRETLESFAGQYLAAVEEAGRIYGAIAKAKAGTPFITEISVDESAAAQTPEELFFILAAAALEKIPVQTIAPKWSGRFNKGIDFAGDVARFGSEFAAAVEIVRAAVREFGLPENLKLSLHSGSDKFSIYPLIKRTLADTGAGLHLKTAGTTWLEEAVGLAEAGGEGWEFVKALYRRALERIDDVCRPYAAVLDLDRSALPAADELASWTGKDFVRALEHNPREKAFNPHLRQLIHVSYGIAAERGAEFYSLLEKHASIVGRHVTENLLARHLRAVFPQGS